MTAAGSVGGSPDSAERADSLDRFGVPAMTFSGLEPPMGRVPARGGHTEAILVERAGALDEGDT